MVSPQNVTLYFDKFNRLRDLNLIQFDPICQISIERGILRDIY